MEDPRQTAQRLIGQHAITLERLWLRYWAEGGTATEPELDALIYGALTPPPEDLTILSWAIEDIYPSH